MTTQEVAAFVIYRWLAEHDAASIMLQLVCLGHPASKADVLAIIRGYVDISTENKGYRRRELSP